MIESAMDILHEVSSSHRHLYAKRDRILAREKGGQAPGKLELTSMTYQDALAFCYERDFDVLKEIPNFEENFRLAQKKAGMGWTRRKEMPVIDTEDVKKFQTRLEKGFLDIRKPFSSDAELDRNPFPEGLSGEQAQKFLDRGLRDGSKSDDVVPVSMTKKQAGSLKPIQKQIYFDKSMGATIENGIAKTLKFIQGSSIFIGSSDNFIIDGHHRFLTAVLLDPDMNVQFLEIDLPIDKLLPLSLSYGDAIGNKRNQ